MSPKTQTVEEAALAYPTGASTVLQEYPSGVFTVIRAGKEIDYPVSSGYGYFISSLQSARNLAQLSTMIEVGFPLSEVQSVIDFLQLKIHEIATAASVSTSTVTRWKEDSSIGTAGSHQFFKIDEIIKKGVALFGTPALLRTWLVTPNMALGDQTPRKLLLSVIGIALIDEALDALHFGNVM